MLNIMGFVNLNFYLAKFLKVLSTANVTTFLSLTTRLKPHLFNVWGLTYLYRPQRNVARNPERKNHFPLRFYQLRSLVCYISSHSLEIFLLCTWEAKKKWKKRKAPLTICLIRLVKLIFLAKIKPVLFK